MLFIRLSAWMSSSPVVVWISVTCWGDEYCPLQFTPHVSLSFFVMKGSWHLWLNFLLHLHNINSETHSWLEVILKWTGWLCQSFICNRVALVFTGGYCSLWRDMSPHWKWSASILSPHFFLIRWFVSLGNWSQPQPHRLWKFKPATYPSLCEIFLMNKILSGKNLP